MQNTPSTLAQALTTLEQHLSADVTPTAELQVQAARVLLEARTLLSDVEAMQARISRLETLLKNLGLALD